MRRFIPAVLFIVIAPYISSGQEVEISDSTEKYRIIERIRSRHYSYNDHNLNRLKCTIANSLIEQLDSIMRAGNDKLRLRTSFFKFSVDYYLRMDFDNPRIKGSETTKERERLAEVIKKSEKSLELMLGVLWGLGYGRAFNPLKRGYRLLQHDDGYRIVRDGESDPMEMEISDEYVISTVRQQRRNIPVSVDFEYRTAGRGLLPSKMIVEMGELPRHEVEIEYQIIDGILVPSQLRLLGPAAEEIFKAAGLPVVDTGLVYLIDNYKLKFHK